MKKQLLQSLLFIGLFTGSFGALQAAIRYVKPAASGTGDGLSWANASGDLQAMINASAGGDEVWVAKGTYKPTTGTGRNATFNIRNGLAIYGGFTGNETTLSQRLVIDPVNGKPSGTILSGDLNGDDIVTGSGSTLNIAGNTENSYQVVAVYLRFGLPVVLDGFVISGAANNGESNSGSGGGLIIYNSSGSFTAVNCLFQNNKSLNGGAIHGYQNVTTLTNCAFQNNLATYNGGAIYFDGSQTTLANCKFLSNSAGAGGAIYNNRNSPTLTNCMFQNNTATSIGGAIFCNGNLVVTNNIVLTNCLFQNNTAEAGGGGLGGGAINNQNFKLWAANCSFQANSALQGGAMLNVGLANTDLINCVLFGNGGGNSIVNIQSSNATVSYSLLDAGVTGITDNGNNITGVTTSPFVSTTSSQLSPCSPAINAGNNAAYTAANGPETDVAGNPRFFNNGTIDMGAYEYQGNPVTGSTLYVNAAASPNGNGISWNSAFTDLQSALSVARSCSSIKEIWVAKGTYQPAANTSFRMINGVSMYGGFAGIETDVNQRNLTNSTTTLKGNGSTVISNSNLSNTAILNGFTITGGNAGNGGGMYNLSSSPTIVNCTFLANQATNGGGIFCDQNSNPNIINCSFLLNQASYGGGGVYYANSNNSTVINCSFSGNKAAVVGGGIFNTNSNLSIVNCIIWGNGSEVFNFPNEPIYKNCLVKGLNLTTTGSGNLDGTLSSNDPLFVSQPVIGSGATGNLYLQPCSPVINKGNNNLIPSYIVTDIIGNPRIVGGIADMGAYEYQGNPVTGSTLYVNAAASPNGNGISWNSAFTDLQSALSVARSCSNIKEIWVAKGTYKPTSGTDRSISFSMVNGVKIYGGFNGNEASLADRPNVNPETGAASSSILSGDIGVANSRSDNTRQIIVADGVGTTTLLDGFVVQDAYNDAPSGFGSGMLINNGSPVIKNCTFFRNSGEVFTGAIVAINSSNPEISNCLIIGNQAVFGGSGVALYSSNAKLSHCTFSGNVGNSIFFVDGTLTVDNCIVWNNGGGIENIQQQTATVRYSIIQGGYPGVGNLNVNPLFVLPTTAALGATGNFRLQPCSPAINAGDPATTTNQAGTIDLDGNPRKVGIIDMGAYEYQQAVVQVFDKATVTLPSSNLLVNTTYLLNITNILDKCARPYAPSAVSIVQTGPANVTYTLTPGQSAYSQNLVFERPGNYTLKVLIDNVEAFSKEVTVNYIPQFASGNFEVSPLTVVTGQPVTVSANNFKDQFNAPFVPFIAELKYLRDNVLVFSKTFGSQPSYTDNQAFTEPGSYQVQIYIDNLQVNSANVTVTTANINNTITASGPTQFCRGSSVTLTAPEGYTYAWTNGATSQSITVTESGNYSVVVSDAFGNMATSSIIDVEVIDVAQPQNIPLGPTQICQGSSVRLVSTASTGNQWYKNGEAINGATDALYSAMEAGSYYVVSTNLICTSQPSNTIQIGVNPVPDVSVSPQMQTILSGSAMAAIVPSGSVTGTVFNWTRNNTGNVTGIATSGSGTISGSLTNTTLSAQTVTFTITPLYSNAGTTCIGKLVTASVQVAAPLPIVKCKPATIYLNAMGQATLLPVNVDDGSKDALGGTVTLSLLKNNSEVNTINFSCAQVGQQQVTLLARDASGNTATCVAIVTVIDQLSPTLTGALPGGDVGSVCKANAPSAPSTASIADRYTDNCGAVTATYDPALSGVTGSDCQWTATYVYHIADKNNNTTADAVITYTGGDKTAPALTGTLPGGDVGSVCKANAPAAPSTASIAALYTDNCGTVSAELLTSNITGTDCGWTATYTYQIKDACGNTANNAVITYTGADKTAPALTGTLPGGDVASVCKASAPSAPSAASIAALYIDNCGAVSAELLTSNITGTDCGWTATYTYQIKDACGNTADNAVVTYTGGDKTAPALTGTLPGGDVGSVCKANAPAAPSAASIAALYIDNCGAVSAELLTSNITGTDCGWTATYTYQIKDACGNTADNAVVTYTGGDKTAPALTGTLPGGDVGSVCKANAPAAPSTASIAALYTDNCGTVSAELLTSQVTGTNQQWTATYTYAITDACGNAASNALVTYTGGDNEAPTITSLPNIILKACEATATWQAPTAADNCAGVTVTQTAGLAPGSVIANGTTVTVEYTAEDAGGLKTKTSFTITRDAELKGNATSTPILCFSGQSQVTIAATGGRAPYSYSNGTETNTTGSFMQPAGTTTYTVTDAAGCIYSFDNNLTQPSAIVVNAAVTSNYNGAQVSCFGRADGQITLTSIGGTGTLSYSLDGVSTNNTGVFSNLAAAVYTYRVTDANGCVKSAPIELTQPAKLEVTETHTDIGCLIGGISNVTIKATGGTQPYSFTQQAQGGSTNSSGLFTQLPITQYSYQVADKNGCSAALQLAIQPNDFTAPSFSRPADITIAPAQGSTCYNALPAVTGNVTNANDDKTLASSLLVTYTDVVSNCGYSTIIKRTWHVEDGCRNAAPEEVQTITVTDNKTPYIVLATKEVKFGRGNIINGSVGVSAADGKASFDRDSKLLSPEFVKAASITKDATANINTQYTMPATDGPNPVFYPFAGITKGLGNYTVSTSTTVPINANYEKLTIKKGVTVTIGGTLYGDINIEDGAKATFAPAGGILNIENLKIKDAKEEAKESDAGDKPNRIVFSNCTSVRIKNKVEIGKNTKFNVDGPRVTIYLGDDKTDEEKFTVSGGNTEVQANIYLKNGKLKVNGNDNQFNFNTVMTGWYIVEKLEATGKNILWNRNACTTTSTRSTAAGPGIVRQPAQNDYFAVKALPNPSTTNFRLLVQSYSSEPVTIRITDRMGRVVSVQSNVQKNSVIMVGNNLLNGTYFAEVLQGKHRQIVQLVKLK